MNRRLLEPGQVRWLLTPVLQVSVQCAGWQAHRRFPYRVPCLLCAGRDGLCYSPFTDEEGRAWRHLSGLSGFHPLRSSPLASEPKPGRLQAPCSQIQSLTMT